MKRIILYLLIVPTFAYSQEVQQLSLTECYKLSRENHPYYQDRQRIQENTNLKLENIKTQWLPQLNANAQATYQSDAISLKMLIPDLNTKPITFTQKTIESSRDQYKATVDINQMLYDGGSVAAQKEIANSSLEADLLQNESELHKLIEQVNQVYFGLFLYKSNILLLENVQNTLLQRQKTVEASLKSGTLQESDLDYISIEILKNKQQIEELKLSYSSGIAILSELTGKKLNDSLKIELPLVEIPDTGTFLRADLKSFEAQKTSIGFTDKFAKSQRLPRVYAFAQGGYGRPGLNMLQNDFAAFYYIGINLKWNIWDWNKTSRDRQSLAIQRDMLDSRRLAIEKNLKISLDNSNSRIGQLEKSLKTDSAIVGLRKVVTQRSSAKLEQGVIIALDYINDFNAETQAEISMLTHKVQLAQEKVNYLTIKGIF
jgi:outer membrane protein TolC